MAEILSRRIDIVNPLQIEPLGDGALLLRLGDRIDDTVNQQVLALAAQIEAQRPSWLHDCVPAYAGLAIFIDNDAFSATDVPLAIAETWLRRLLESADAYVGAVDGRIVDIPVRYGGADGPDLATVAAELAIAPAELIARHSAPLYRVAMIGFAPGFPYLLGLDPTLNSPRLATPRSAVPAGSVGIGGSQTGIYPCAGPGGWRLIGRTSLVLFDASNESPSLLRAGDRVRFIAADLPA